MSLPKPHPSLPAPVVHQSHMTPALSKSHVLAGVQDAYWSDEDADDEECPLCLEEMDISDLGFKPCPCGYQICRFCWNHIKENLNARCPACRREYSEEGIEFKPVNKEDHKRLTLQKKQRERERKDLDALGRRHLTNVRVVQRNVVYVVGLGSRFAKEELIPTLRSSEYFGQYGRITKILLVKRTPPGGRGPVLGLYITYYRREDAARAIAAVDGSPSPSGGGDVMRASYGTTKYCIAFLRGVSCSNHGCMDLHDWGDPKDCFTKEDLTTLKHTMKDTETRSRPTQKADEMGLPRSAGWGQRSGITPTNASMATVTSAAIPARSMRRGHKPTRSGTAPEPRTQVASPSKPQQDRKAPPKPSSQASSSRPSTPGPGGLPVRPTTPSSAAQAGRSQKTSKEPPRPLPPKSPTGSAFESDPGSSPALSLPTAATPPITMPAAPPGLPAVPPGLTNTPPGLPIPANTSVSSPLTREASGSSYQISTQAQALLDDVMNRRETTAVSFTVFPDLDRTLQNLTGGDNGGTGGFNFNLDPKLAVDDEHFEAQLPDLMGGVNLGASSSFDPFSNEVHLSSSFRGPPGLSSQSGSRPSMTEQSATGYIGSFNPFGEANDPSPLTTQSRPSPLQDDESSRRMSRFGFARERQNSNFMNSSASSPLISANTSLSSMSYHDSAFPTSAGSGHAPWPFQRQHDLVPPGLGGLSRSGTPVSMRSSPLVPYAHAQPNVPLSMHGSTMAGQSRFQLFDVSNDASTLKEMLGVGQQQRTGGPSDNASSIPLSSPYSPFQDPAIMSSASFASSPMNDNSAYYSPMAMEPPSSFDSFSSSPFMRNETVAGHPGFQFHQAPQVASTPTTVPSQSFPPGLLTNTMGMSSMMASSQPDIAMEPTPPPSFTPLDLIQESSVDPSPVLSTTDFPALPTSGSGDCKPEEEAAEFDPVKVAEDDATRVKAERRAAKKAAAAKRATEREQLAKEKQAEKERLAKEKAEEKARLDKEKAEAREKKKAEEKERLAREKVERERAAKEKAQRERADKERLEAQKRAEAEKAAERAEKAKVQQAAKKAKAEASQGQSSPTKAKAGSPALVAATPMLSKLPKKNKPATKPLKIPKDNDITSDSQSAAASAVTPKKESPQMSALQMPAVSEMPETPVGLASRASPAREVEIPRTVPKSVAEMLDEIENERGPYYLDDHPFFDMSRINPAAKVPLDYETMSQALSAFPASSGSFNDSASRLNDKTVVCFQQLLETLTQTMSDLVQILPQTTWGSIFDVLSQDLKDLKRDFSLVSSTSFDGLVHDDLPEDADEDENDEDFDDGDVDEYESGDPPTPTMDKRAKWMEIQLAKLEELHRDVNAAAVRAILMNSDRGWDPKGVLPHASKSLMRFEMLGTVGEGEQMRMMTKEELETKMVVAKEAVVFAETELREAMQALREATS